MAKLIITIEEKSETAEDGKTLVGFATERELQGEDKEKSALAQMLPALDLAVSMIIRSFFSAHGVDCAHEEHSDTPLESLASVMSREIANHQQPFPSEL